ncbi:TPA: hypothetical protein DD449_03340 [Candidatus Berkelbacteria bacterium]|uniref:Uncharacterized protein n=1 Tax=Berkelbacteria bacterium GW2011_GWE1_39_12 TaxID=1618337 RepID=A0A0G4B2C4_9BACT|nr:MAG: hypothetical protein UT28_C0001G0297 [Berkelbacteria bacterium GW2011_GWE1_39_12]HBO60691.1 hypothetical protein [Candidatus Berkelbacteria bacterium]
MVAEDVIASQPIICYAAKSRRLINRAPIIKLLRDYPGEWQEGFDPGMPYRMIVSVESDRNMIFSESHLQKVQETIYSIVERLPSEYRRSYYYITNGVSKDDAIDNFDIPRAIEYLTIASSRFVLDSIRLSQGGDSVVSFQGTVLPSVWTKKKVSTKLWLMHDLGPSVDPLVMTCLDLASETVSRILAGTEMDLVSVLVRKVARFTPVRAEKDIEKPSSNSFFLKFIRAFTGQVMSIFN